MAVVICQFPEFGAAKHRALRLVSAWIWQVTQRQLHSPSKNELVDIAMCVTIGI
ncbi:hypothetical protein [Chamaesiphon sp.]|uniref:hypothetical protein n=1 Tax=Chamaesiphon sp. TaxID=2814140 RepID=UPI003592FBE1